MLTCFDATLCCARPVFALQFTEMQKYGRFRGPLVLLWPTGVWSCPFMEDVVDDTLQWLVGVESGLGEAHL